MTALRHYSLPLLLAVLLHGAALLALSWNFSPGPVEARIVKPLIVRSELIVLEPKARPKQKSKPEAVQKPVRKAAVTPEPKTAPKPEPRETPEPVQKTPPKDTAAGRQRRLDDLAAAQFEEALATEAQALTEAVDALKAEQEAAAAQSFRAGIHQAVVAQWSRPPSARRGMEALLLVELVPTGEVVAVTLVASSGSAAFDRSAEAAVRKARRFLVPEDPVQFERHFRRFQLQFKPEDLWR